MWVVIEPSGHFLARSQSLHLRTLVDTKQKTIHLLPINPTQSPRTVHEETIAASYETVGDVDPRKRTIRTAV